MHRQLLALLVICFTLVACSGELSQEDLSNRPDGKVFQNVIQAIVDGDVEEVRRSLHPSITQVGELSSAVALGRTYLVDKKLTFSRFLSYSDTFSAQDGKGSELKTLMLFKPEDKNGFVVNCVFRYVDNVPFLIDVKVQEIKNVQPLSALSGKNAAQNFVSALRLHPIASMFAAASFIVTICGIWVSIFGKGMAMRWLWFVLSTVGFCIIYIPANETAISYDFLSMVWPTFGVIGIWLFKFGLTLTIGEQSSALASAMGIYFSIPIGAIITLLKWDDFRRVRVREHV